MTTRLGLNSYAREALLVEHGICERRQISRLEFFAFSAGFLHQFGGLGRKFVPNFPCLPPRRLKTFRLSRFSYDWIGELETSVFCPSGGKGIFHTSRFGFVPSCGVVPVMLGVYFDYLLLRAVF